MEIMEVKKCPKCASKDIIDTRDKTCGISEFDSRKIVPESDILIFRCKNCKESLKYNTW